MGVNLFSMNGQFTLQMKNLAMPNTNRQLAKLYPYGCQGVRYPRISEDTFKKNNS